MTKARKQLLQDAERAGYDVHGDNGGTITILKRVGRWKKLRGLVMYPDGCAVRAEIDLECAAVVTSFKDMRAILEI